jgi:hypothetical protein
MFNRQVGVWSGPGWSPGWGGCGSGQALPRAPLLHPAASLLLQATFHYTSLKTNRIFVMVGGGDCQIHHLIFCYYGIFWHTYLNYSWFFSLKGPSHKIWSAWIWYGQMGLGVDMRRRTYKYLFKGSVNFVIGLWSSYATHTKYLPIHFSLGSQQVLTITSLDFPLIALRPMWICFSLFPYFLPVECVGLPRLMWYRV